MYFSQIAASVAVAATVVLGISGSTAIASKAVSSTTAPKAGSSNLISLLTAQKHSNSPTNTVSDKLARQLQVTLDKTRLAAGVPGKGGVAGATLAIASRDDGQWFGSSGVADLATGTSVAPQDQFRIGSATKTFTATVVLQLVDEGKLKLDDTLDKWLPSIAKNIPNSNKITIRQLLNGTSGIYDYLADDSAIWQDILQNPYRDWKPEELVSYIYGRQPTIGKWVYPNTSFILLGMIVEKATNSSLASQIENRIIKPLGLKNTFFTARTDSVPGGIVHAYWDIYPQDGIDEDLTSVNMSVAWAAGTMVSNTQDLIRFGDKLFRGKLLKPRTLKEMLTFIDLGNGFGYGLGIWSNDTPWGKAWRISGSGIGTAAALWYLPNRGLTIVSLSNQEVGQYFTSIRNATLELVLGKP
ncbi:beta-lactamase family protein [Coleofasciculus sp. FACHB-712]|uniref:serine hydrolase domain-containing protein n=1 Tax=Coleofasciculus sp. FACHB-712 TaxID=2692789 RepID=UPI001687641B|nr:serine hydrolase domain-containing protein [Coleofasciculus sp. FACHB-712]MBD1940836.1 beta-lactamase family protein [Coleofasciculus sp. FACHB-712]